MQPLQPYYLGFSRPPAPRLASAQKCLRTGDIEEVGKTERHLTFFEMLGNFAPTGDYFKETAIPLAWELVTKGFGMPVERLRATVHPSDDEAFEIWTTKTAIPAEHVTRLGDNWWGLGRGPCGPDSEIWWDRGKDVGCGRDDCVPDHCQRFTEFWNLVFPQYDQRGDLSGPPSTAEAIHRGIADGSLVPLARPAIDTGMGLERFSRTLEQGIDQFERVVAKNPKRIPGDEAFKLHDTFGFQLELTRELADERGIEVDDEGFKTAMAAQRERSRGAIKQMWTSVENLPRSEFTGYRELSTDSKIAALRKDGKPVESATEGDAVEVFVER